MNFILISIVFNLVLVYSQNYYRIDELGQIETNGVPGVGKWSSVFYCPSGKFATGFKLDYEYYRGTHASWCAQSLSDGSCRSNPPNHGTRDDNGVVGLHLICHTFKNLTHKIESESIVGYFPSNAEIEFAILGSYIPSYTANCNQGYVNGLSARIQTRQGISDDAGITNVKLKCTSGELITGSTDYDQGVSEVEEIGFKAGGKSSCQKGEAVCGLKVKTVFDHHDDNEGINDIIFYCCKLPKVIEEQENCDPEVKWVEVGSFINLGNSETKYTFSTKIGVSNQNGKTNTNSKSETSGKDTGYSVGTEVGPDWAKITASFEQKFSSSNTNEETSEISSIDIFSTERESTQEIIVNPHHSIRVLQKIGTCRGISVKTSTFKREDKIILNKENETSGRLEMTNGSQKIISKGIFYIFSSVAVFLTQYSM